MHDEEEHREKQLRNTAETTLADITERENSGHQAFDRG